MYTLKTQNYGSTSLASPFINLFRGVRPTLKFHFGNRGGFRILETGGVKTSTKGARNLWRVQGRASQGNSAFMGI